MSLGVIVFLLILSPATASSPEFPCSESSSDGFPFCDASLSTGERARSLVAALTLPEKIGQLCNNASAVARLGIPAYEWWSESLHGVATNGPGVSFAGEIPAATGFPQVLVMAASFSRELWRAVGAAVATEARAMYNSGQAGLTFWAPNINIFRDPRWGRGQETPGEDPTVASSYAVEFVTGFQGGGESEDDDRLMMSACCKHLAAYDLEKWGSFARYNFNAVVTDQDFEDTFQPPFRSCVEQGKSSCLMCSYNAVNGIPACARKDLLDQARHDWGFNGYITSDCDAVATVYAYQHYTNNSEDAVADVLKAGTDINCGTYLLYHTLSAVQQGKVREEEIDRALVNLFSVQIRLGLFDGDPKKGKYGHLGPRDVCSSEHKALALEAARQGIVLLKNKGDNLPLKKDEVSSVVVIGPLVNDSSILGGTYSGIPCSSKSLVDGFKTFVKNTTSFPGCGDVACESDEHFKEAIAAARKADRVVLILGIDLTQETEDRDRVSLLLPGKQSALASAVAAVTKKPVIFAVTGGGPIDVSFAEVDPRFGSVLWIGYPGEAGGQALAEIVFSVVNPSGRLPVTWYPEAYSEHVAMNDMAMRADPARNYPGRTHRFYGGPTVYPFGHGLSYGPKPTYKFLSLPTKITLVGSSASEAGSARRALNRVGFVGIDEVASCDSLRFSAEISVSGRPGRHVVMLFSRPPGAGIEGAPARQLVGFKSVRVGSVGSVMSATASVEVAPCEVMSFADVAGRRVLALGDHVLVVGGLERSISFEI